MPATGDFVSRGITTALRRKLDRWISLELLPAADGHSWPAGGLRLRAPSLGLCGLIVDSSDALGRRYPLALVCPLAPLDACERWAAAAHPVARAAADGRHDPESLIAALPDVPPQGPEDGDRDVYWSEGAPPNDSLSALFV